MQRGRLQYSFPLGRNKFNEMEIILRNFRFVYAELRPTFRTINIAISALVFRKR